jgi:trimeric autotransporter adhesin
MRAPRFAPATLLALAIACASSTDGASSVATVELSSSTLGVVAGADAPLTARLLDAGGHEVSGAIVWSSRDPSIATVAPSSAQTVVVRGVAPGTTQVAANFAGRSAVATVTVTARAVATVDVQPSRVDLRLGGSVQLVARALDATGAELAGRAIAFASSDTTIAKVTASGLVTAVATGGTSITVSSEGRSTLVAVVVTPVPVATVAIAPTAPSLALGGTVQLQATTRDSTGATLAGRAVAWTSQSPNVASVSSTGLVTALAVGTTTVTATSEGRSASVTVTVTPRPVASVTLTLPQPTLAEGDSAQLAVTLADAQGQPLTGRVVTFASSDTSIARVSATGMLTAIAPGAATITATSEGVSGTLAVRVVPVAVASVTIAPDSSTIHVGGTVQLVATARSASGTPIAGRPVVWTSGAPGIASVASDGTVTGLAVGTVVIFAQVSGVAGTATVVVTP